MSIDRIKPAEWGVIPALVKREWDWFWEAIAEAYPFWEGGGAPLVYGPGGRRLRQTTLGTGAIWGQGAVGLELDVSSQTTPTVAGTGEPLTEGDCAIFAAFSHNGNQGSQTIVTKRDTWATNDMRWFFGWSDPDDAIVWNTAGDTGQTWTWVPPAGGALFAMGLTDNGTNSELFLDGKSQGTQASLTFDSDTGAVLSVGANESAEPLEGGLQVLYLFARALTATEQIQLSENPFGPITRARSLPIPYVAPTTRILRPAVNDGIKSAQWDWQPGFIDPVFRDLAGSLVFAVPIMGGDGRDLIRNPVVTTYGTPNKQEGPNGPAYNFDGVDERGDYATDLKAIYGGPFSIEVLIRHEGTAPEAVVNLETSGEFKLLSWVFRPRTPWRCLFTLTARHVSACPHLPFRRMSGFT